MRSRISPATMLMVKAGSRTTLVSGPGGRPAPGHDSWL
jgi:hypothetical protein